MRYLCVMALVVFLTTDPPLAEVWVESGPEGGMVTALVAMPSSPDHLLCGPAGGGLYRSLDGGRQWLLVEGLPEGISVNEIVAASPESPAIIYAATGSGLFRSDDGGNFWVRIFDQPTVVLALNPMQPAESGRRQDLDSADCSDPL